MKLDQSLFAIDPAARVERLCAFVRESQFRLNRDGVLVPFSGGLDSSTVLLLCARAVGTDQVTALLMPEKHGNPDAERYAQSVADLYGIRTITRDISGVLRALGTYRFPLSAVPFRSVQNWVVQTYLRSAARSPFVQVVRGRARGWDRRGYASYVSKQRVRLVVEYLVAEERNLLVAGAAHRTEDLVGLFVKFGVDDGADIMPLKNLYRSHITQLAEFLGVPEEVRKRTPNPDIIPGVSDKYADILGVPCDAVDLLLYGIEHDLGDEDIAAQLGLPKEKVHDIRGLVRQTEHMRNPSLTVTWES